MTGRDFRHESLAFFAAIFAGQLRAVPQIVRELCVCPESVLRFGGPTCSQTIAITDLKGRAGVFESIDSDLLIVKIEIFSQVDGDDGSIPKADVRQMK